MSIEFDGNEPEPVSVMTTLAPVVPGRSYRLTFKVDPSRLTNQQDAGFTLRISERPKPNTPDKTLAECPLLPVSGESATCAVTIPKDLDVLQIELIYKRAPGTVRAKGILRIQHAALEFAG
jgi:hypothetical protein